MKSGELLADAFGRVNGIVQRAVKDLSPDQLTFRPTPDANSIAWLIWHLTRVQDDHLAGVAGTPQLWTSAGWMDRFALPFDAAATGYGFTADQVAAVAVDSPDLLVGYQTAVHEATVAYVLGLTDADLDRIVDTSWTPAVTLGVRLVSFLSDGLQHAGQASYVRGLLP
jgi:uncharacterized damage-inducible protein DinB